MIRAINLCKAFGEETVNLTEVLKSVNVTIQSGEFVAIVGESGSGKSTLLNLLSTLQRPTSGSVLYDDDNIYSLSNKSLAYFRNRTIGFIFQEHHLFYELTAFQNILLPASIANQEEDYKRRAEELLEIVNLQHRKNYKPSQLSGGQCQRIAVARALLLNPQYVFADEPTGSLDTKSSQDVFDLLKKVNQEAKTTIIMVTHNKEMAEQVDRIITIQDGEIFSNLHSDS